MSIYITQQQKEEWESNVLKIETELRTLPLTDGLKDIGKIEVYKELLSKAIVLPVETTWGHIIFSDTDETVDAEKNYPNGVIIRKSK